MLATMKARLAVLLSCIVVSTLINTNLISSYLSSEINSVEDEITTLKKEKENLVAKVKRFEEQSETTNVLQKTLAVVHMGIPKTGSTTLQRASKAFSAQLREDGYEMPWVHFLEHNGKSHEFLIHLENQKQLSTCFVPRTYPAWNKYQCVHELLLYGLEIAKEKKNVFISAEAFAFSDRDGMKSLSTYLSHWDDKKIIIYYRRLYDWLISHHYQRIKKRTLSQPWLWEKPLNDLIVYEDTLFVPFHYTSEVVSRAQEYFTDVVVVNMHDESKGLTETFYCDILPNASHTCDAVSNERDEHKNSGKPLVYQTLAYGAKKHGLINIETDEQMRIAAKAVQRNQEDILNLTYKDFKMKCLSQELETWLFETSMRIEQTFFPKFFNKTSFDEDFKEKAKFGLCELDVEAMLDEKEWKDFFESFRWKI